jgi:hypothetical protein
VATDVSRHRAVASPHPSFAERLLQRLHRLRTSGYRALRPDAAEAARLRARVLARVRELGRTYEDGNSDLLGYTYHPIPFEGFEHLNAHRPECDERLRAILDAVTIRPGDWVLDVGANVGFFAFSLARLGAIVEAYEPHSASFEIGAALSKLYRSDVLYINRGLSEAGLRYLRPRYRAILLLSVFHWIVKQDGDEAAERVLRDLAGRADVVFFEVPASPVDGMFRNLNFVSRASLEAYLARVLPDATIVALSEDDAWAARPLYAIRHARA